MYCSREGPTRNIFRCEEEEAKDPLCSTCSAGRREVPVPGGTRMITGGGGRDRDGNVVAFQGRFAET